MSITSVSKEPDYWKNVPLKQQEKDHLLEILGRYPTLEEAMCFSSMWSEHISYKSSRRWFKYFYTDTKRVFLGIGEGAGLMDIGDNYIIGFKVESHNHPSAISPFEGAATGVGGIIRDIISHGLHPIGLLDSIRFGKLDNNKVKNLFDGVIRGIASYGNCVGIPNIGGEVEFATEYTENPLVNVMCIGVAKKEHILRSIASKSELLMVMFGATTGKDGIGGVTFASEDLDEKSDESRSAVQIGDPLKEKILIDVIAELNNKNLLKGLQDFGGGGMICATSEIVAKKGFGAKIYLDRVPLRDSTMVPWEIIVSESQERMLALIEAEDLEQVSEILEKYELAYANIGEVTAEPNYQIFWSGEQLGNIPITLLVDNVLQPERSTEVPDYIQKRFNKLPEHFLNLEEEINRFLKEPNVTSKNWVYEQYDKTVQGQTVRSSGNGTGLIHLPNGKVLSIKLDALPVHVYLDPYSGSANSFTNVLRSIIASGAEPLALVDNLNFGNPEYTDSYWQFVESIKGIGQATHDFSLPVIGGNVSLYNEAQKNKVRQRILPTPSLGIVGLIDSMDGIISSRLKKIIRSMVMVIGPVPDELSGSEYLRSVYGIQSGSGSTYTPDLEKKSISAIQLLQSKQFLLASLSIGKGGLLGSVFKLLFDDYDAPKFGLDMSSYLPEKDLAIREWLFSETSARFIIQVDANSVDQVEKLLSSEQCSYYTVGTIIDDIILNLKDLKLNLTTLWNQWIHTIPDQMNR